MKYAEAIEVLTFAKHYCYRTNKKGERVLDNRRYDRALEVFRNEHEELIALRKERTKTDLGELPTIVEEPINGTGLTVNGFHFNPVGVEGTYMLDQVAFVGEFDEYSKNDWKKSSGKKKLQKWTKKNLTKEILEQFEVDLPTVEEVFSQKMLNLYNESDNDGGKLKSKQFPIFQNSDNRMMEFDGKPMWWWTKTALAGDVRNVWFFETDGNANTGDVILEGGFVPVLRRKPEPIHAEKRNKKEEKQ